MYHPSVIEREQATVEQRTATRLTRYDQDYSWAVEEHLGTTPRSLSKDELAFVKNERLLSSLDFRYWSRYAWLLPDAAVSEGNLVRYTPWDSQELLMDCLAKRELEQYDAYLRKEPQDGNLMAVPKARAEGASLHAAMIKMHRTCTNPYTIGITASENGEKRTSLYQRDMRIWERLPWWLRPERTEPDRINERMTFGKLDCALLYEDYAQKSSLAAGEQYLVGHMSEVAQGDQTYIEKLMELDYFPAIPQSWRACHILESTPAGMGGYWHPFIMDAARGKGRWRVKFIPWYATGFKYRRTAPADWSPSQHALEHARKVEETSPGYMGRVIVLTRDQLYWWETTREEYRSKGNLVYFLTNYPATLQESFQFSGTSIFDIETLDYYNTLTRNPGGCYEIT